MLFAEVVAASAAVAATPSRTAKVGALAELLASAGDDIETVTAWLAGEPRQGRIGIGWRSLNAQQTPPADEPTLTVVDVDRALTELAATTGAGSANRRAGQLAALLSAATTDEQRFLVRLFAGELRQGALEAIVLDAVVAASGVPAALARRAFMLTGSLPATAALALQGGADSLSDIRLQVLRPVRPMLASPGSSLEAALASLGNEVTVEHKLDGARIQAHRDGDVVRVWTRSLREITERVPEIVTLVLTLPCRTAVLDGETLALDDEGRPRSFQDSMSRFGSEVLDDPDSPVAALVLSPFFFDLLHLDGRDLLDEPLEVRLDLLETLLAEEQHAGLRMPGRRRPTSAEAAAVLEQALAAGHEGVVVKALDAPYAAGRRGKSWQKVKPVHTLDLVVLAAEWGHGRRSGSLSNIHLGARDPAPELVVEIAVDGAQRSSRYPGGVALRFARVVRYRPDKTPAQADSLYSIRALL
jgi:DNA ligase-1